MKPPPGGLEYNRDASTEIKNNLLSSQDAYKGDWL
jgi:hypothetical protein